VQDIETVTASAASLARDFKQLTELAGGVVETTDAGTLAYATSVMKKLAALDAQIGKKSIRPFSKKIVSRMSAQDWAREASTEAAGIVLMNASKLDFLEKISRTVFRRDFYVVIKGEKPVTMREWLEKNHDETHDMLRKVAEK